MGINRLKLDNYKPLRDVVFENIRGAIMEGVLKPGERLMEIQLAEQLGVSRTPVREAIRKLELEGLVIMLPRKGAYVADMSKKDLIDVLEVRLGLEGLAAYYAAERIRKDQIETLEKISEDLEKYVEQNDLENILKMDEYFHMLIFDASGNSRLKSMIISVWETVYRFRIKYMSDYNSAVNIVEEHKKLIEALKKGKGDLAEKLAREHIEKAEQFMIEQLMQDKTV
ncbi:GntR family transcriptional regulator [Peptostreptococcus equinus]|uniref:GntR family transcriptional regulator n=1 Tax=Peptostreptococcus equinus TaxID=3003601 RepID=A0ABY7JR75_9FIRM|nr:GntR family transcriptional regulator [Peptostreptococcus sp. CBA3647]WAW15001.1 GntR family transcriptional regulator [Peptostreptococcus sp. CBA3647]